MIRKVTIATLSIVIFMAVAANWTLGEIKKQFHNSLQSQLQTILTTTHEALKNWEELNKEILKHYVHIIEIDKLALKLSKNSTLTGKALTKHPLQQQIRETLSHALERDGYQGFFVISPDYINLASTRDSNLGQKSLIPETLLAHAFSGDFLLSLPMKSDVPLPDAEGRLQDGQPTMFMLGPIREHSHKTDSPVVAILAFRIAPAQDFAHIAHLGRLMKSGETYLFNKQGKMLNESRFIEELHQTGFLPEGRSSVLNLEIRDPGNISNKKGVHNSHRPFTKMAQSALKGDAGFDVEGYNNYRGIPVVGAWQWDHDSGIGLATEINTAEAYQAYYTTRKLVIGALCALALFAASIIFLFTKKREDKLKIANRLTQQMSEEARKANETLQQELKLSEALANMLQRTTNATTEKELLDAALDTLTSLEFFGAQDIGAGFLVNQTTQELTLTVNRNLPKPLLTTCSQLKFDQCLCGKAAESKDMQFTAAANMDTDIHYEGMIPYGKYSVPFLVDDKVEGVFVIYMSQGTEFQSDCAGFLYAVADIISGAIKRVRAEKTTIENERFASLGAMVAGIAHEINSPVGTAVTNISELIEKTSHFQQKLKSGGIRKSDLDNFLQDSNDFSRMAQENLFRAAELVRSFKLVAVDQSNEVEQSFNLLEHINATITTLYHEFKRTAITTQVDCPPELTITSLPGPFSQIITNLTQNSRIHGFNDSQEAGEITISAQQQSNQIILIYTDNGCGMNEEQKAKVFDPFYTTRRNQGGSGLGMNIVHNLIIQTLNGTIELKTAVGQGVKFTITIPLQEMEPTLVSSHSTEPLQRETKQ